MTRHGIRHRRTSRVSSERGVSLIHVAVMIFILTAFSAFVLDHGVMMLARGQAQNVADAAALAGVTTRVKDEPNPVANPPGGGLTETAIQDAISRHWVFGGTAANIGRVWSWNCPPGVTGWCVKVDVFRDGQNGSTALPVFFANLLGATEQKVRATATAVAKSANGTSCLKPWLIPDRWAENTAPPGSYDPPGDVYVPYDYVTDTPGTGYTLANVGDPVLLKPGNPHQAISPSDFYIIGDANVYEESIIGCKLSNQIGDVVTVKPGNEVGPTNHGVDALLANGPVDVVIGMFDPAAFAAQDRSSGTFDLRIVNMIGVRITERKGNTIEGVIIGGVGEDMGQGPTPTGNSSLLKAIQLVR